MIHLITLKIKAINFSKKKWFQLASWVLIGLRGLLAFGSLGVFIYLMSGRTETGDMMIASSEFYHVISIGHGFNNAVCFEYQISERGLMIGRRVLFISHSWHSASICLSGC
jgi:hypothetical protein